MRSMSRNVGVRARIAKMITRAGIAMVVGGFTVLAAAEPPPAKSWRAFYAGPAGFYNNAKAITTDAAGNVYVTGESATGTGSAFATVKYSPQGVELWTARYLGKPTGSDKAFSVLVGPDGNIIVAGTSDSPGPGFSDYVVVKYNAGTGAQMWATRVDGPASSSDFLLAAGLDAAGNVFATGQSYSGADYDWVTIRLNGVTGSLEWLSPFNGVSGGPDGINDAAVDIAVDPAGNSYVAGWVQVGYNFDEEYNIYAYGVAKYDPAGVLAWSTVLGNETDPGQASKIVIDSDGNPVVTGNKLGPATYKLSAETGDTIWGTEYLGPENTGAFPYDMKAAPGGGVVIAGSVCAGNVFCDESHAVWKIDDTGMVRWSSIYTSLNPNRAGGSSRGLALDAQGNAYTTGFYMFFSGPTLAVTRSVDTVGAERWIDIYHAAAPGAADSAIGLGAAIDPAGALVTVGTDGLSFKSFYSTIKYESCKADFDGSGFVDTDDFDAFVFAFEAGTDNADFDGSGFVDTDDYDAFVHAFEAGC